MDFLCQLSKGHVDMPWMILLNITLVEKSNEHFHKKVLHTASTSIHTQHHLKDSFTRARKQKTWLSCKTATWQVSPLSKFSIVRCHVCMIPVSHIQSHMLSCLCFSFFEADKTYHFITHGHGLLFIIEVSWACFLIETSWRNTISWHHLVPFPKNLKMEMFLLKKGFKQKINSHTWKRNFI